jgi:hypothetical protein
MPSTFDLSLHLFMYVGVGLLRLNVITLHFLS